MTVPLLDYRLQHTENLKNLEKWKKLQHINVVQLREVIVHTRAFGDNCESAGILL